MPKLECEKRVRASLWQTRQDAVAGVDQANDFERAAAGTLSAPGAKRVDKGCLRGKLMEVKVSLPAALEDFVSSQVKSGEFDDASEVVGEALRLPREAHESKAWRKCEPPLPGLIRPEARESQRHEIAQ
jgi:putative addiction module CopG family antidote